MLDHISKLDLTVLLVKKNYSFMSREISIKNLKNKSFMSREISMKKALLLVLFFIVLRVAVQLVTVATK